MTDTQRKIMFHRICDYCHAIYKLEEQGPLNLDNEASQESYDKAIKELYTALQKMTIQERRRRIK